MKIRAKKLGVYLREARTSRDRSTEDLSEATGISAAELEAYEIGAQSPSLPELELIAYNLRIPLEHFIQGDTDIPQQGRPVDPNRFLALRQRIIGTQLRKLRVETGLMMEDLSQKAGLDKDTLHSYEMGDIPVPLPQFEVLLSALNVSMRDFQDKHGAVGEWLIEQQQINAFLDMPESSRAFITKPINMPYLELAMRLSEMSVAKLRAVAEGLLEITL